MLKHKGRFEWGNYKHTFVIEVDVLLGRKLETQERIKACDDLIEAYVSQTGQVPDGDQLKRLADYILQDELKDRHPDKVTNTEFPFLSWGQQKLRGKREVVTDNSWFTADKKYRMYGRRKNVLKNMGI